MASCCPGVTNLLVADLADVNWVREQFVKGVARERSTPRARAGLRYANLRNRPAPIEIMFQKTDATQFEIPFIDVPNELRFLFINLQPANPNVVAERAETSHPHALLLGGSNLVADPLAGLLSLKLSK